MPTIRIIFVFLIYSYGILTIAHAKTAAVFINVPCDSVVRDEFIQWKDNAVIKKIFSPIIILDDIPEPIPMRDNIIMTIKRLHEQMPQSVFFFIYGIRNPDHRFCLWIIEK